jgi:predicted RNase H-like nuclease (RuvC/YqgF family)
MSEPLANNNSWSARYSNVLQSLVVLGMGIAAIWAGVINPLVNKVDDVSKSYLSIREHNEFKARYESDMRAIKDELHQDERDVAYLRDNQVSRPEHTVHWEEQKDKIADLHEEVTSLRRDFGGQYTVGKKIDDLQNQLDILRSTLVGVNPNRAAH